MKDWQIQAAAPALGARRVADTMADRLPLIATAACVGAGVALAAARLGSRRPALPHGVVVYYHSACQAFTGRADGIIRMLEQAGCKYTVRAPSDAPPAFAGEMGCFAVPFIQLPCGLVLSQSQAIMQHLGRLLGLHPRTAAGEARALQVALNMGDLISEGGRKLRDDPARLARWLDTFEGTLRSSGSGYMVGDELTYADFACYSFLKLMVKFAPAGAYSLIGQFVATMDALPAMRAFNEAGVALLPASMMP